MTPRLIQLLTECICKDHKSFHKTVGINGIKIFSSSWVPRPDLHVSIWERGGVDYGDVHQPCIAIGFGMEIEPDNPVLCVLWGAW